MIKVQPKKIYWFLIYPLAALIFLLLSVIFILSAKGYSVHLENGILSFEKTGMLIVSSKPSGADITLDGEYKSKKTSSFFATKLNNLKEDVYTLGIEKEGYYSWEKEMRVSPEMVTWADYVLLFSKDPEIEKIDIEGSLVQSFPSLDKKRSLFLTKTSTGETLYGVNNDSGEKDIILETDKLDGDKKISGIRIADWSKDNKNILVAGSLAGDLRYWAINADSKNIEDLSLISPIKFDRLMFSIENSDDLYGSLQGEVRRINLKTKSVSNILAEGIIYFIFSPNGEVYYIKDNNEMRSLYLANSDFLKEASVFDNIPISDIYEIKISDKDQKVALKTKNSTVYVVANVGGKNSLITMGKNISDFSWSPEGNRFLYKEGSSIVVFEDEEYKKESKEYIISGSDSFSNITWYGNHHLLVKENRRVRIMDFDGTNQVVLGDIFENSDIFHMPDNGDIYFFSLLSNQKSTLSRYKVDF